MIFDAKFAKMNGKTREELSAYGRNALAHVIATAIENDIDPRIVSFGTLGLFTFFTATDGSVDTAELELFNSFGGKPVSGEDYAQMAQNIFTEDGAKAVLLSAKELMDADPANEDALAELAMVAIISNGEITADEKDFYITLFDR